MKRGEGGGGGGERPTAVGGIEEGKLEKENLRTLYPLRFLLPLSPPDDNSLLSQHGGPSP